MLGLLLCLLLTHCKWPFSLRKKKTINRSGDLTPAMFTAFSWAAATPPAPPPSSSFHIEIGSQCEHQTVLGPSFFPFGASMFSWLVTWFLSRKTSRVMCLGLKQPLKWRFFLGAHFKQKGLFSSRMPSESMVTAIKCKYFSVKNAKVHVFSKR